MAADKSAPAPTKETPVASLLSNLQRVIPGFSAPAPVASKSRSRNKKTKSASVSGNEAIPAVPVTEAESSAVAPVDELDEVEEKKTSAVEAVHKRIRAVNKKLVSLSDLWNWRGAEERREEQAGAS
jgi:hypothetical protein